MQIRKFVPSVLKEGIKAGTNARNRNPGPGLVGIKNCTKHANNKIKNGPYRANRVFSKCILRFYKPFDIFENFTRPAISTWGFGYLFSILNVYLGGDL